MPDRSDRRFGKQVADRINDKIWKDLGKKNLQGEYEKYRDFMVKNDGKNVYSLLLPRVGPE